MRKNKNSHLVAELIKRGLTQRNAYRIINESNGQAANVLIRVLVEFLELKAESQRRT